MINKLTMLIVIDGFGINPNKDGNAIKLANTPNFKKILENYPNTYVETSGLKVGLPEGQMGNSEVGHTNIGAGRVVYQELTRISKSIVDGDFFENPELLKAIENCKKNNSKLHLMGLVSDGGVHSHITHLYGLLRLAKKQNFNDVFIHCFLDGRDVPPASAMEYITNLEENAKEIGVGKVASISGRYYAMDRDKRWERVQLAYDALVLGKGEYAQKALEAVENSYKKGENDEFVRPTVLIKDSKPVATVGINDSVIFFNFRPDRARELTRALVDDQFDGFERPNGRFPLCYVCMTQYDVTIPNVEVAFKPESLDNTFGEYISKLGYKQLRIAETEKYAHVTFFFNGGIEAKYDGEERILIPSPKVATYDMKPEMSAYEVTDAVIEAIESKKYDVIIMNYANPDMVGHTGILEAAIKAIETIDNCIGKIVDKVFAQEGVLFITSDHGNADQMKDYETGGPMTAHTTNPTPLIIAGSKKDLMLKPGKLADIAPTMLEIMGLEKPKEMTGESLIVES